MVSPFFILVEFMELIEKERTQGNTSSVFNNLSDFLFWKSLFV